MISAKEIGVRSLIIASMIAVVVGLIDLTGGHKKKNDTGYEDSHAGNASADHAGAVLTRKERLEKMAASWSGDVAYGASYAALTPLSADNAAVAGPQFNPADDYWGLPRSDGVDTVSAFCSACHSLAVVMQQRQDENGWDYLLTWMVEKQGMADPGPEMRQEILDYLTREFGRE